MKRLIFLILLFISVFGFSQTNAPLFFGVQNVSGIPTDGLVAYYPFNGNANDESGNGNDGTIYGATLTTDRFNNINKSYAFNGLTDYIDIGTNFGSFVASDNFTITGWVKVSNIQDGNIIGRNSNSAGNWLLRLESGKFRFVVQDINFNTASIHDAMSVSLGSWYFVLGVYSNKTVILYVNNINKGSNTNNFLNNQLYQDAIKTLIGKRDQGAGDTYFNGSIDDIRIYNRALTEQEITALYLE